MSIASKPLEARRATRNRFFFRALMKNDNQYLDIELQDNFLFFKLLSFTLLCYSIPSKLIHGECWTKDCLAFILQAKGKHQNAREGTSSDQLIWLLLSISCFPGDTVVKNLPLNAGEAGSIPGFGRSPGVGNGNPLQCSCLENSINRGIWWATVHGVAKSWTQLGKRLSRHMLI